MLETMIWTTKRHLLNIHFASDHDFDNVLLTPKVMSIVIMVQLLGLACQSSFNQ